MTKKQSIWFFGLGIFLSAMVMSLPGNFSNLLGYLILIYTIVSVLIIENNGYAK